MSRVRRLVGSVGGIGLLPGAPGTWASAATVAAWALLFGLRGTGRGLLRPDTDWSGAAATGVVLLALAALYVVGVLAGNGARADWSDEDPGEFVLDEVVGQGLALLPLLASPLSWQGALLAFVLFRLLDITKPFPCGWLEERGGGTGIMADDVAAGLYASIGVLIARGAGWLPA